jgi:hypothetical protein
MAHIFGYRYFLPTLIAWSMADSLARLKIESVAQTGLTYLPLKSLFSFSGKTEWLAQPISLGFAGGILFLIFLKANVYLVLIRAPSFLFLKQTKETIP